MAYPDLKDRPVKNTICLFDVDGTLTPARRHASPEMLDLLHRLRQKVAIGFVGGSDLVKQQEQLGLSRPYISRPALTSAGSPDVPVTSLFDFCFSENGLTAYRLGQPLPSNSFLQHVGEQNYQRLAKFCLKYISNLDGLPAMRGTFIEFRNGMINVSPVGRNASQKERDEFQNWDSTSGCRKKMVETLRKEFVDLGLTYSIGGQISFDVFPQGWDKTYCLKHVEAEKANGIEYSTIHFFGDKAFEGGNDWEIYSDSRTVGHAVKDPDDTMKEIKALFDL